ncbi:MAG: carbon-nitrogen hydrolase family protein, partial [Bauldia litoralis]
AEDIPERYAGLANIWPNTGDSCVIDPRGEIVAGPAEGETILVAEIAPDAVLAAKAACDVGGHYARPDIFKLTVDRRERTPISDADD